MTTKEHQLCLAMNTFLMLFKATGNHSYRLQAIAAKNAFKELKQATRTLKIEV